VDYAKLTLWNQVYAEGAENFEKLLAPQSRRTPGSFRQSEARRSLKKEWMKKW
jgi:hypothetical protein